MPLNYEQLDARSEAMLDYIKENDLLDDAIGIDNYITDEDPLMVVNYAGGETIEVLWSAVRPTLVGTEELKL